MSEAQVFYDLSTLSLEHNFSIFRSYLKKNSVHLKIIQAEHDVETPTDIARLFVNGLDGVQYGELKTDHSFGDCRDILKEMMMKFFIPDQM